MKVIGSVFQGGHKEGDFNWMVQQTKYDDALFVFNDNEQQYIVHRDDPTDADGCSEGAGNGVIRPWQCKSPPRAAGVPTGPSYAKLTPHITKLIDEAVATVGKIAADQNCARIFYSADSHGHLGTGTFQVGDDVKAYILQKLKALET
jgi:hypothetical protein